PPPRSTTRGNPFRLISLGRIGNISKELTSCKGRVDSPGGVAGRSRDSVQLGAGRNPCGVRGDSLQSPAFYRIALPKAVSNDGRPPPAPGLTPLGGFHAFRAD